MNKIIIFDFNRTLFDPEKQSLIPGVVPTLEALKELGFKMHLISMAAESRSELIKNLGLNQFFHSITLCQNKTLKLFNDIISAEPVTKENSFVIGDRVAKEIRLGNELNLNTIWYKQGRFAEEEPKHPLETPTYTVTEFHEILWQIQNHKKTNP